MTRLLAVTACAIALGGCGEEESETTAASTTTTATSTQTATSAPETATDDPTTTPEPEGGGPAAAGDPVAAASAVLTAEGTDEQACEQFVTPEFIQTAYGGKQNCIASRTADALAQGLSLGPAIERNATEIVVIPQGGPYDGVEVEVGLVREGDGFRVDSLVADVPAGP